MKNVNCLKSVNRLTEKNYLRGLAVVLMIAAAVGISIVVFSGSAYSFDEESNNSFNLELRTNYYLNHEDFPILKYEFLVPLYRSDNSLLFFSPKYHEDTHDDSHEWQLGLGYRHMVFGDRLILGGNVYYDTRLSHTGNEFEQVGLGIEVMGEWFEMRANGYLSMSEPAVMDSRREYYFAERSLSYRDYARYEAPMSGFDTEVGFRMPYVSNYVETWVYGGGYYFEPTGSVGGSADTMVGYQARVKVVPTDYLHLDFRVRDDNVRGTDYYGSVNVEVPFSIENLVAGKNPFEGLKKDEVFEGSRPLEDRLYAQVERDPDIITGLSGDEVTNNGSMQDLLYVDNTYSGGSSDGSWSDPYTSIAVALGVYNPASDVLFVLAGDTVAGYAGFSVTADDTTIWGQGYDIPGVGLPHGLTADWPVINHAVTINASNVEISGLKFTGINRNYALKIDDGGGFNVHHNYFAKSGTGHQYGIMAWNLTGDIGSSLNPVVIEGNYFDIESTDFNYGYGILLGASGTIYADITDNLMGTETYKVHGDRGAYGIYLTSSTGGVETTITGNEIYCYGDNIVRGVNIISPGAVMGEIDDNTIDGESTLNIDGMFLRGYEGSVGTSADPLSISGNDLEVTGETCFGVRLYGDDIYAEIEDNERIVVENGATGGSNSGIYEIAYTGDIGGSISGNTLDVSGDTAFGVYLRTDGSGSMIGNDSDVFEMSDNDIDVDAAAGGGYGGVLYADGDVFASIIGNDLLGGITGTTAYGLYVGSVSGNLGSAGTPFEIIDNDLYAEATTGAGYGLYLSADNGTMDYSITKNHIYAYSESGTWDLDNLGLFDPVYIRADVPDGTGSGTLADPYSPQDGCSLGGTGANLNIYVLDTGGPYSNANFPSYGLDMELAENSALFVAPGCNPVFTDGIFLGSTNGGNALVMGIEFNITTKTHPSLPMFALYISGEGDDGIKLRDNTINISNTTIDDTVYGILVADTANTGNTGSAEAPHSFINNNITVNNDYGDAYGIFINAESSLYTHVVNNAFDVTSNSGNAYGVSLNAGDCMFADVTDNDLSGGIIGWSEAYGIYLGSDNGGIGAQGEAVDISGNSIEVTAGNMGYGLNLSADLDIYADIAGNDLSDGVTGDYSYGIYIESGSGLLGNSTNPIVITDNSGIIDGASERYMLYLSTGNPGGGNNVDWGGRGTDTNENDFIARSGGSSAAWTGNFNAGDTLPAPGGTNKPVYTDFIAGDTLTPYGVTDLYYYICAGIGYGSGTGTLADPWNAQYGLDYGGTLYALDVGGSYTAGLTLGVDGTELYAYAGDTSTFTSTFAIDASNVTISDLSFAVVGGNAVEINGGSSITIHNNTISTDYFGIFSNVSGDLSGLTITDNDIDIDGSGNGGNPAGGMSFTTSAGDMSGMITGNDITAIGTGTVSGITADISGNVGAFGDNFVIDNNTIYVDSGTAYGVSLYASDYIFADVIDNDMSGGINGGSGAYGIYINSVYGGGGAEGGIGAQGDPVEISGNSVEVTAGSTGYAIYLFSDGDYYSDNDIFADIIDNPSLNVTSSNSNADGIHLGSNSGSIGSAADPVTISGNVMSVSADDDVRGIVLGADNTVFADITDNDLSGGILGGVLPGMWERKSYGIYLRGDNIGSENVPVYITGNNSMSVTCSFGVAYGIYLDAKYDIFANIYENTSINVISNNSNASGIVVDSSDGGLGSATSPLTISGNSMVVDAKKYSYGIDLYANLDIFAYITDNDLSCSAATGFISYDVYGISIESESGLLGNSTNPIVINDNSGIIDGSKGRYMLYLSTGNPGGGNNVDWGGLGSAAKANNFTALRGGIAADWTGNFNENDILPAPGGVNKPVWTNFDYGDTMSPFESYYICAGIGYGSGSGTLADPWNAQYGLDMGGLLYALDAGGSYTEGLTLGVDATKLYAYAGDMPTFTSTFSIDASNVTICDLYFAVVGGNAVEINGGSNITIYKNTISSDHFGIFSNVSGDLAGLTIIDNDIDIDGSGNGGNPAGGMSFTTSAGDMSGMITDNDITAIGTGTVSGIIADILGNIGTFGDSFVIDNNTVYIDAGTAYGIYMTSSAGGIETHITDNEMYCYADTFVRGINIISPGNVMGGIDYNTIDVESNINIDGMFLKSHGGSVGTSLNPFSISGNDMEVTGETGFGIRVYGDSIYAEIDDNIRLSVESGATGGTNTGIYEVAYTGDIGGSISGNTLAVSGDTAFGVYLRTDGAGSMIGNASDVFDMSDNDIDVDGAAGGGYGSVLYANSDVFASVIRNDLLDGITGTTAYGLYINSVNGGLGSVATPLEVIDNDFYTEATTGDGYGLYLNADNGTMDYSITKNHIYAYSESGVWDLDNLGLFDPVYIRADVADGTGSGTLSDPYSPQDGCYLGGTGANINIYVLDTGGPYSNATFPSYGLDMELAENSALFAAPGCSPVFTDGIFLGSANGGNALVMGIEFDITTKTHPDLPMFALHILGGSAEGITIRSNTIHVSNTTIDEAVYGILAGEPVSSSDAGSSAFSWLSSDTGSAESPHLFANNTITVINDYDDGYGIYFDADNGLDDSLHVDIIENIFNITSYKNAFGVHLIADNIITNISENILNIYSVKEDAAGFFMMGGYSLLYNFKHMSCSMYAPDGIAVPMIDAIRVRNLEELNEVIEGKWEYRTSGWAHILAGDYSGSVSPIKRTLTLWGAGYEILGYVPENPDPENPENWPVFDDTLVIASSNVEISGLWFDIDDQNFEDSAIKIDLSIFESGLSSDTLSGIIIKESRFNVNRTGNAYGIETYYFESLFGGPLGLSTKHLGYELSPLIISGNVFNINMDANLEYSDADAIAIYLANKRDDIHCVIIDNTIHVGGCDNPDETYKTDEACGIKLENTWFVEIPWRVPVIDAVISDNEIVVNADVGNTYGIHMDITKGFINEYILFNPKIEITNTNDHPYSTSEGFDYGFSYGVYTHADRGIATESIFDNDISVSAVGYAYGIYTDSGEDQPLLESVCNWADSIYHLPTKIPNVLKFSTPFLQKWSKFAGYTSTISTLYTILKLGYEILPNEQPMPLEIYAVENSIVVTSEDYGAYGIALYAAKGLIGDIGSLYYDGETVIEGGNTIRVCGECDSCGIDLRSFSLGIDKAIIALFDEPEDVPFDIQYNDIAVRSYDGGAYGIHGITYELPEEITAIDRTIFANIIDNDMTYSDGNFDGIWGSEFAAGIYLRAGKRGGATMTGAIWTTLGSSKFPIIISDNTMNIISYNLADPPSYSDAYGIYLESAYKGWGVFAEIKNNVDREGDVGEYGITVKSSDGACGISIKSGSYIGSEEHPLLIENNTIHSTGIDSMHDVGTYGIYCNAVEGDISVSDGEVVRNNIYAHILNNAFLDANNDFCLDGNGDVIPGIKLSNSCGGTGIYLAGENVGSVEEPVLVENNSIGMVGEGCPKFKGIHLYAGGRTGVAVYDEIEYEFESGGMMYTSILNNSVDMKGFTDLDGFVHGVELNGIELSTDFYKDYVIFVGPLGFSPYQAYNDEITRSIGSYGTPVNIFGNELSLELSLVEGPVPIEGLRGIFLCSENNIFAEVGKMDEGELTFGNTISIHSTVPYASGDLFGIEFQGANDILGHIIENQIECDGYSGTLSVGIGIMGNLPGSAGYHYCASNIGYLENISDPGSGSGDWEELIISHNTIEVTDVFNNSYAYGIYMRAYSNIFAHILYNDFHIEGTGYATAAKIEVLGDNVRLGTPEHHTKFENNGTFSKHGIIESQLFVTLLDLCCAYNSQSELTVDWDDNHISPVTPLGGWSGDFPFEDEGHDYYLAIRINLSDWSSYTFDPNPQ